MKTKQPRAVFQGLGLLRGARKVQMKITKNVKNYKNKIINFFSLLIDCQHLSDQASLLQYKINEYKTEKEKLTKKLLENKTDKHEYVEKLEKDIRSYKNMTDSCIKTCSQLAEELMVLRKEIEKYTGNVPSSTLSSNLIGKHVNSKK
jgi:hypothetical protein